MSSAAKSKGNGGLSPEEKRAWFARRLREQGAKPRPSRCLHRLFEAQVERTPEACGLRSTAATLSYAELNRRANRLARHLKEPGSRPGIPSGTRVRPVGRDDRRYARGAQGRQRRFVPLDPDYPAERLAYLLAGFRQRLGRADPRGHEVPPRCRRRALFAVDIEGHSRRNRRSTV